MAIPISEYISITDKVIANIVGERDFSGLVFSKVAMKTGAPMVKVPPETYFMR